MRLSKLMKAAPVGGPVLEGQLKLALDTIPEGFIREDRAERPFLSVRLSGEFSVLTREDGKRVRYLVTPSGVTNVWLKVIGRMVDDPDGDSAEGAPEATDNE